MSSSNWTPIAEVLDSALGGVDWSASTAAGTPMLDRCDPYFVWADVASMRDPAASGGSPSGNGFPPLTGGSGQRPAIQVLLELPAQRDERMSLLRDIQATATHRHAARSNVHFRPVVMPVDKVPGLVARVADGDGAIRFEYMAPRALAAGDPWRLYRFAVDARRDAVFDSLPLSGPKRDEPERRRVRVFSGIPVVEDDDALVEPEDPDGFRPLPEDRPTAPEREYDVPKCTAPRLCVIDDRFNFVSPRLGRLNFGSIWLQGAPSARMQEMLDGGHFTEARSAAPPLGALHGWCVRHAGLRGPPPAYVEAESYRRARLLRSVPRWSHGSAVLDLFGRRGFGQQATPEPIVDLVQLAASTVVDTTGGALSGHVLEGIHDALQQAKLRRVGDAGDGRTTVPAMLPEHPLVVNLSYGHHGGPHDGSSMFERAVRELLDAYENLHVVVSAGNSHQLRTHASAAVAPGGSAHFRLKVLPDNAADAFVEIWTDAPQDIEVTVTPPGGPACTCTLGAGQAECWSEGGVLRAALIYPRCVAQSTAGSMALLAIAPTRRVTEPFAATQYQDHAVPARRRAGAPHGVWTIGVRNKGQKVCHHVHAWAQRGDAAPARERANSGESGRQAYFLDRVDKDAGHDPQLTLNGIATLVHDRYHVVGAMRRDPADLGVALYSAAGPTRHVPASRADGPDVVVPGDESLERPGLCTSGMLSSSRLWVGGTSMAAALYARWKFDQLTAGAAGGGPPPPPRAALSAQPTRQPMATPDEPVRAQDASRGQGRRRPPADWEGLVGMPGSGLPPP